MLLVLEACSSCRYAASALCGYQGDAGRVEKVDASRRLNGFLLWFLQSTAKIGELVSKMKWWGTGCAGLMMVCLASGVHAR